MDPRSDGGDPGSGIDRVKVFISGPPRVELPVRRPDIDTFELFVVYNSGYALQAQQRAWAIAIKAGYSPALEGIRKRIYDFGLCRCWLQRQQKPSQAQREDATWAHS